MASNESHRQTLQERLNIPYNLYHTIVSILIGVAVGIVIIIIVGIATRDTRPTQYMLLLLRDATNIDLTNTRR